MKSSNELGSAKYQGEDSLNEQNEDQYYDQNQNNVQDQDFDNNSKSSSKKKNQSAIKIKGIDEGDEFLKPIPVSKTKMLQKKQLMSDEKSKSGNQSEIQAISESPDDSGKKGKKRYNKKQSSSAQQDGTEPRSLKSQLSNLSGGFSGEKSYKRPKLQSGENLIIDSNLVSNNNDGDETNPNEDSKVQEDGKKDANQSSKTDIDKKEDFSKKPVRKWEKRWVLQPNVIEYGNDIWIQKWICVDNLNTVTIAAEPPKVNVQYYEKVNGLSSFPIVEALTRDVTDKTEQEKQVPAQPQQEEITLQEHIQYEKAAQQTLDLFTPLQNAEMDMESVSKKYVCQEDDCGKVFYDQGSYRKHQMTHGERMYICKVPTCGKKFLDNSKLKRHQLVHTGEKPYKCDICSKKFSLDFNLRTHLRTHTGEKPYVCSYPSCHKRFTQSSNLTAHERTHSMRDANGQFINSQGGQMIMDEDGNMIPAPMYAPDGSLLMMCSEEQQILDEKLLAENPELYHQQMMQLQMQQQQQIQLFQTERSHFNSNNGNGGQIFAVNYNPNYQQHNRVEYGMMQQNYEGEDIEDEEEEEELEDPNLILDQDQQKMFLEDNTGFNQQQF
eukprot:403341134